MRRSNKALFVYLLFVAALSIGSKVFASEYRSGTPNGEKLSKGEVVMTLAKNPKAVIYKVDQVELNEKKGTVVIKKED